MSKIRKVFIPLSMALLLLMGTASTRAGDIHKHPRKPKQDSAKSVGMKPATTPETP